MCAFPLDRGEAVRGEPVWLAAADSARWGGARPLRPGQRAGEPGPDRYRVCELCWHLLATTEQALYSRGSLAGRDRALEALRGPHRGLPRD